MRIAINLTREELGGITSSNLNILGYLYNSNCEIIGIELNSRMYMRGPTIFRPFSPEIFEHHIINIHNLPIMKIIKSGRTKSLKDLERAYAGAIKFVREVLRKSKPDIILLSGTYYMPWVISVAARKEGVPILLWYSGILSEETEHMSKKFRSIFSAMEKDIAKNASKIIFPSKICRQVVEKKVLKGKTKNSYIIPNPISNTFTEPYVSEYSIEKKIAAVGRYTEIKNFDKFFDLHRELLKRKWQHAASFLTSAGAKIRRMPKTIDMLPPMTSDGLKNFYLAQGLIVCPSKFETFGNVPMEAVCLGIPVLVSDKMGCAEILKQVGLENMVISFDDMGEAADRVEQLCGQSILPKQSNAIKKILNINFVGEEILAVMKSMVDVNDDVEL